MREAMSGLTLKLFSVFGNGQPFYSAVFLVFHLIPKCIVTLQRLSWPLFFYTILSHIIMIRSGVAMHVTANS